MKVMARLSYILSLALYNIHYNREINSIGFAIFDSPRDKDLDLDKYGRFLEKVDTILKGQIILTGSVKDKQIYATAFGEEYFLPTLFGIDRLLKVQKVNPDNSIN